MNIKNTTFSLATASLLLAMGFVNAAENSSEPEIIRVPSKYAAIEGVRTKRTDGEIVIYGRLVRRHTARGPLPGHIDVQVVGADSQIIKHEAGRYRRVNRAVRSHRFAVALPAETVENGSIHVIHHISERRSPH